MKKSVQSFLFSLIVLPLSAQTVSSIEETTLPPDSYYDGSDFTHGFTSGNAFFHNTYDTTWGAAFGYWAEGWAYSNIGDTVTQASNFTQLYNAKALSGYSSSQFAVGTQSSRVVLNGAASGKVVYGTYITNSTYAFNSMKLGDSFAKKFGGATGNDPDYFKLAIYGYLGGTLTADSVEFYLADFRFSDNTQDYMIDDWTWVDLSSLGNVDSLVFYMRSSDVGSFGINTPVYFCLDHFFTADSPVGMNELNEQYVNVFPNPFNAVLTIQVAEPSMVMLRNVQGQVLFEEQINGIGKLDASMLPAGIYFLQTDRSIIKLIKN